jgi:DNA-binding Lrp family transcriptional regulator
MTNLLDLFSDNDTRRVFEKIADKRTTDFREISQELNLPDEAAGQILDRLERDGLLRRVRAPLPVLDGFTLSAKGMAAQRQMKALARG